MVCNLNEEKTIPKLTWAHQCLSTEKTVYLISQVVGQNLARLITFAQVGATPASGTIKLNALIQQKH